MTSITNNVTWKHVTYNPAASSRAHDISRLSCRCNSTVYQSFMLRSLHPIEVVGITAKKKSLCSLQQS